VKNEKVLQRVKEECNSQQTIKKKWKANCIGHTLCRHCLPKKKVTEIKTKETRISARTKKP